MSKYDPVKSRKWYLKNRERLLEVRRAYNKKKNADPEFSLSEKIRNQSPERKAYRKQYKKTEAGRESNNRRRSKPDTKFRIKLNRIRIKYGISAEDYQRMMLRQSGKCLICLREKELHVDHDHVTGIVRGLLCSSCNLALGLARDDKNILNKMIEYLDGKLSENNSSR